MPEDSQPTEETSPAGTVAPVEPDGAPAKTAAKRAVKKATAKKSTAKKTATKKTAAKKATTKKAAAKKAAAEAEPAAAERTEAAEQTGPAAQTEQAPAAKKAAKKATAKKSTKKSTTKKAAKATAEPAEPADTEAPSATELVFQPPSVEEQPRPTTESRSEDGEEEESGEGSGRRRRRRGGRRRRKAGDGDGSAEDAATEGEGAGQGDQGEQGDQGDSGGDGSSRRRRRRRRAGDEGGDGSGDDPQKTTTRVRKGRSPEDQITALSGSTRLEAKKQRRREGREAGRRRAPIVSEAEFLARRESVDRVMAIRQRGELTQIGVLEDKVLVEHYVARESQTSLIGNVYLGRVQNVLPSMEAAFIDIGRGRNAVLYAGEVNWSALGHKDGQPRKIESVLSSGQAVLVQVTKDPIGHKGARLTSQISLAGRFLVYVPDGTTSGISRKLPDTERNRLKTLLKELVPDTAGVIVRTAAEGASEAELTSDVERLKARWSDIEKKTKGSAPQLLYGEPDLTLKVVRDLFTEDFSRLVIQGADAWETVQQYVAHVAPDLEDRLERYEVDEHSGADVFTTYRIDEQIAKALDRKVWLPSGGSLIIDRTEAMTVVDVNTGKFTGSGGNLEETVTKNNLEAAEEVVRQLRLRDIGGIIVVDFIDMVLESNRDLVLRRLVECLGRDRTRHQVAEVTSLGLVQMTRKRIGTGLLEAFSETCEHCGGRGLILHDHPVEPKKAEEEPRRGGRRGRGGRGKGDSNGPDNGNGNGNGNGSRSAPSPADVAAMARHPKDAESSDDEASDADVILAAAEELAGETAEEIAGGTLLGDNDVVANLEALEAPTQVEVRLEEEQEAAPEPEPAAPTAPPEAPVVVTRTRRRSASRPAGPPASTASTASTETSVEQDGQGDEPFGGAPPEGPNGDPIDVPTVEHVPIKRKGSRKR